MGSQGVNTKEGREAGEKKRKDEGVKCEENERQMRRKRGGIVSRLNHLGMLII